MHCVLNTNAGSPVGMNFINVSMFFFQNNSDCSIYSILQMLHNNLHTNSAILSVVFTVALSNSHVLYWYEPYDVVQFWTLDFYS